MMNGLYFKLWGLPNVYKHVQKDGETRYLFQAPEKTLWIIAPDPTAVERDLLGPGCALARDSAGHPMNIASTWKIWHPAYRLLMDCGMRGADSVTAGVAAA